MVALNSSTCSRIIQYKKSRNEGGKKVESWPYLFEVSGNQTSAAPAADVNLSEGCDASGRFFGDCCFVPCLFKLPIHSCLDPWHGWHMVFAPQTKMSFRWSPGSAWSGDGTWSKRRRRCLGVAAKRKAWCKWPKGWELRAEEFRINTETRWENVNELCQLI